MRFFSGVVVRRAGGLILLLYCEDRKTYHCWPSYRSIGEAVRMSVNTVRKYIAELEERGLIVRESTSIVTRDGRKRNGTLRYTILPRKAG